MLTTPKVKQIHKLSISSKNVQAIQFVELRKTFCQPDHRLKVFFITIIRERKEFDKFFAIESVSVEHFRMI